MSLPQFDVIVTWPRNADYPLWRKFVRDNRDGFNDVFVVFMQPNQGHNYMPFVLEAMTKDNVRGIISPNLTADQDWRDVAVNEALKHSTAEWVWFTEQDFVIKPGFWEEVSDAIGKGLEVVGVMDGDRLHPCSLMIKRSLLDRTSKFFGIDPDRSDHFSRIQKNLSDLKAQVGIIGPETYHHYAGMSHNWRLVSEGGQPNYHREAFLDYLVDCLECGIEIDPTWRSVAEMAITAS